MEIQSLRHVALSCCVLCTAAGAVRLFWPENVFKGVINSVLMLYIITAGLTMLRTTDWQGFAAQLYRGPAAQSTPQTEELAAYRDSLARQTAAAAVREILEGSGIRAGVAWADDCCLVTLVHPQDDAAAQQLLAENLGQVPYRILVGGETP